MLFLMKMVKFSASIMIGLRARRGNSALGRREIGGFSQEYSFVGASGKET